MKDLHLVADLPSLPLHQPFEIQRLVTPEKQCITSGIRVGEGFLRATRWGLEENEEYYDELINVGGLPRFFDRVVSITSNLLVELITCQRNDYTVANHAISAHANIGWLEPPGFAPSDIRARRFRMQVDPMGLLRWREGTLWHVSFICNGLCRVPSTNQTVAPLASVPNLGQHCSSLRKIKSQNGASNRTD